VGLRFEPVHFCSTHPGRRFLEHQTTQVSRNEIQSSGEPTLASNCRARRRCRKRGGISRLVDGVKPPPHPIIRLPNHRPTTTRSTSNLGPPYAYPLKQRHDGQVMKYTPSRGPGSGVGSVADIRAIEFDQGTSPAPHRIEEDLLSRNHRFVESDSNEIRSMSAFGHRLGKVWVDILSSIMFCVHKRGNRALPYRMGVSRADISGASGPAECPSVLRARSF